MPTLRPPFWRGWPHHLAQALLAMAVVAGLFLVGGFLLMGVGIFCMCPNSREWRAELDIKNLGSALKLYQRQKGHYPPQSAWLQALISIQVIEGPPKDPWNNEYHYALWRGVPRVWSYGADGLPGGEGADADIYNLSILPRWLIESDEPSQVSVPSPLPSPIRCWRSLEPDSRCGV